VQLDAERQARLEAETRLASHTTRATENNTALARNNLRLQEQLARLRGEGDLMLHEAGCQRAAAAAKQREAAAQLSKLQTLLQRAAADKQALQKQLAAKQVRRRCLPVGCACTSFALLPMATAAGTSS
jgi:hypothetical protein